MYKIQDIVSELTLQLRLNISNFILQTSLCVRERVYDRERESVYEREREREREKRYIVLHITYF